jgi:hypothetical protein
MATTKGIGIVYGTAVDDLTYTASAEIVSTSETYERNVEKKELTDRNGSVQTLILTNFTDTLKLKCYPSGETASATAIPGIYEKVTVIAPSDANINGDWLAEKVSKERKVDGHVEFDLSLIRYYNDNGSLTGVMA